MSGHFDSLGRKSRWGDRWGTGVEPRTDKPTKEILLHLQEDVYVCINVGGVGEFVRRI